MTTAAYPTPSIRLDVENGFYIVICDDKRKVLDIIEGTPFDRRDVPKTTYCVRHVLADGTVRYIDLNEALEAQRTSELYLRLAGASVFCGTCKDGIFKTTVTSMYNGKKLG